MFLNKSLSAKDSHGHSANSRRKPEKPGAAEVPGNVPVNFGELGFNARLLLKER